ncbi:MAG: CopG family ribbon-helix-helix protein [Candidatus Thorarchaeota archaeon]
MTKKVPKRKSNFLGFRLSEEILNNLDLIAQQENKTRGLIAKDAIEQWLNLELFNQTHEMMMISKSIFSKILSKLDDPTIDMITKDFADFFSDIMKFSTGKPMNEETLNFYIAFFINFFGKNGLKWFNTLDLQNQTDSLVFRGLHDMDEVYSIFFTKFFNYLLSEYFELEFTTNIEEKTSNLVHLEFKLK